MTDKEPEKLARCEKLKDGSLFFTAGTDDSLDHVSRHGEDILNVERFTEELNTAAESFAQRRVGEVLGDVLRKVSDASSRDRMFQIIVEGDAVYDWAELARFARMLESKQRGV